MDDTETRKRLQEEFEAVFRKKKNENSFGAEAVVYLSAAPDQTRLPSDPAYEMSPENISRAMYTALCAQVFCDETRRIILCGETEQLPSMTQLIHGYNFPLSAGDVLHSVDSGKRGDSHTGTQFEALATFLRGKNFSIILITNQYHVPRVRRYAARHLLSIVSKYSVVGVPNDTGLYDRKAKVEGEIDRIIRYAEQGIFDLFLSAV